MLKNGRGLWQDGKFGWNQIFIINHEDVEFVLDCLLPDCVCTLMKGITLGIFFLGSPFTNPMTSVVFVKDAVLRSSCRSTSR